MSRIISTLLLFAFLGHLQAQIFSIRDWRRIAEESIELRLNRSDSFGNYYLCGKVSGEVDLDLVSFDKFLTPPSTSNDVFIAKFDNQTNNLEWGIVLPGNNSYNVNDIAIDGEENVYITGFFSGIVDFDPGAGVAELSGIGASHTFVAKYDSEGNYLWAKVVGNGNFSVFSSSIEVIDGIVHVLGVFTGDTDFDPGDQEFMLTGSSTSYILELSDDGDFIWAGHLGGFLSIESIDYLEDRSFAIAGRFFNEANFEFTGTDVYTTNGFGDDGFLAFYNSDHMLEWVRFIDGNASDEKLQYLSILDNGNIAVIGQVDSDVEIDGFNLMSGNHFSALYSPSGLLLSAKSIFSTSSFITDFFTDSNGNLYLSAPFNNNLDLNPTGEAFEIIPEADLDNRFLMVMDRDLSFLGVETISAGIDDHTLSIGPDDLLISFISIDETGDVVYSESVNVSLSGSRTMSLEKFVLDAIDNDMDGYSSTEDCDDNNAEVNPGMIEVVYNGLDDDCNPDTRDDDLDQDGFTLAEDCDDNNPDVNSDAVEIEYNGIDDDCNPETQDDDLDEDGFNQLDDCDDNNPAINPDVLEIPYNGIDDDCNPNSVDDDVDFDGFGIADDCNDNNPMVNPDGTEEPYNGLDDDCDPLTLDDDLDQDGFALEDDCNDEDPEINPDAVEIIYNGIDDDCNPATGDDDIDDDGYPADSDCDDNNPDVNPDALEIPYNGIDDDCDPLTLDDDLDQDGFILEEDCDDSNFDINPVAVEIVYNGFDDDCDPSTRDDDLDEDGFTLDLDCDDANPEINPDAEEIPSNGIDEDCDGIDGSSGLHSIGDFVLNIYPNPTTGYVRLDSNYSWTGRIKVYGMNGQELKAFDSTDRVDISDLSDGIYYFTLTESNSGFTIVEKIVLCK